MAVVLQKAVPPALVAAYLQHGYDRVSGYVVRAAEVSGVTDVADLRRLHMVDHEGSLHATTGPLHVLHVDKSPSWRLQPAEGLAERGVLDGSGTVEVAEQLVQVFLLDHTRLTPGARLWRFEESADPVLVGTFHGAAHGWQDHTRDDVLTAAVPSPTAGAVVVLDGKAYVADVVSDDDDAPTSITAVSALEPPEPLGFAQNRHGHWVRAVEHAEARPCSRSGSPARGRTTRCSSSSSSASRTAGPPCGSARSPATGSGRRRWDSSSSSSGCGSTPLPPRT